MACGERLPAEPGGLFDGNAVELGMYHRQWADQVTRLSSGTFISFPTMVIVYWVHPTREPKK